jgi:hypothetical protein
MIRKQKCNSIALFHTQNVAQNLFSSTDTTLWSEIYFSFIIYLFLFFSNSLRTRSIYVFVCKLYKIGYYALAVKRFLLATCNILYKMSYKMSALFVYHWQKVYHKSIESIESFVGWENSVGYRMLIVSVWRMKDSFSWVVRSHFYGNRHPYLSIFYFLISTLS